MRLLSLTDQSLNYPDRLIFFVEDIGRNLNIHSFIIIIVQTYCLNKYMILLSKFNAGHIKIYIFSKANIPELSREIKNHCNNLLVCATLRTIGQRVTVFIARVKYVHLK